MAKKPSLYDKTLLFWLRMAGGACLVLALAVIFLGNTLFEQSTLLSHAGKDLSYVEDQRDALADLLGALSPNVPLADVEAAAEQTGLAVRMEGDSAAGRLHLAGLSFEVEAGVVQFQAD